MPTPMPASIRKRSEVYAKNIHKRGNVRKSLDPAVEQKLEAEALRKKGLRTKAPASVSGSKKIIVAFLLITLGSALYQILSPLFGSSTRASKASKTSKATNPSVTLTPEQQAKAAEAILRAMNQQAAEKYMKSAKNYKPASPPSASLAPEGSSDAEEDQPAKGPLV
ncbi:hypothetical protein GGI12_001906 [Dipsacomyces acuminosporus]|nr:hypothetical protein GGI12_001906 [Dipsacomyces acuminosporus]